MLPVKARFCFEALASEESKEAVDKASSPPSLQRLEVEWRQHSVGLGPAREMRPPGAMRRIDTYFFLDGLQQRP